VALPEGACVLQGKIVAEFQAMVARLNAIFDEKTALLASLGQPHEASTASLVGSDRRNCIMMTICISDSRSKHWVRYMHRIGCPASDM